MICGGSRISYYLAERLLKSGARVEDAAADWLTFDMIR